jgi:hypothetical protein
VRAATVEGLPVPRTDRITVRAIGFTMLAVTAVVLSGCVTTVDGRAAAGSTIAPLSTTTAPSTPSSPASGSSTAPGTTEAVAEPPADETDGMTDAEASYTDLPLGEPLWVTWGDDGDEGEADIVVRSARTEDTDDGPRFLVTVDYECYYGECSYDVDDWTVRGADGRQHRPESQSHFGDDNADIFDTISAVTEKRGRLVFDVPAGVDSVEYDARSGDPATWVVPAA